MATTYDLTDGALTLPWDGAKKCYVIEKKVDCSVDGLGSGDTAQVLAVPAGTFVMAVFTDVATAEGAAATITVGDGVDPDGWDTSVNVNAAALTQGAGAFPTAAGKLYTSADTIDVAGAALDTAVFSVRAICFDVA